MVVVCLVILDAIFVLVELLIDLSVIKLEPHHIAPEVRDRFVHLLTYLTTYYQHLHII